jgi:hypothetical protein
VRQAHFAHAARKVYNDTDDVCGYSVFVAARLMLKQIIGRSVFIEVPAYLDCVVDERDGDLVEWFTATEARRIELTEVGVEQSFGGVLVDVLARVGAHTFVVYVTYPGSQTPVELEVPEDLACGILQLSLDGICAAFCEKHPAKSYRDILMDVLTGVRNAKRWVYHPRHAREKATAQERLRAKIAEARTLRPSPPVSYAPAPSTPAKTVRYACVICGASWEADQRLGISNCRSCRGTLCARPVIGSR